MSGFIDIARIVVEAVTPLSISSGKADLRYDVLLLRDAHDLPAIAGSAMAGALRATYPDKEAVPRLFGEARAKDPQGEPQTEKCRSKSRICVSWAVALDCDGKPVDGPIDKTSSKRGEDEIVTLLRREQPVLRDHVKINERGVAEDALKFERGAVPAGARFALEISVERDEDAHADVLVNLLDILKAGVEIGGASRRGYGLVRLIHADHSSLNLSDLRHRKALRSLRGSLANALPNGVNWQRVSTSDAPEKDSSQFRLQVTMDDYWRTGTGTEAIGSAETDARSGDRTSKPAYTYQEQFIDWSTGKGQPGWRVVMPASGIKGALRHRTLFHLRRLDMAAGRDMSGDVAMEPLFGSVKSGSGQQAGGRAGRLFLQDAVIDASSIRTQVLNHNSIDRFTGGVRNGILFSEEVLYQPVIVVEGRVRGVADIPGDVLKAFRMALNDLAQGRLALGAASAKGHGFGTGQFELEPDWLKLEVPA
ncbi:RAMP superfamily CRISPR-associated protein [Pyruvatibacter mobilis]|uniref:RAMP superfamily CRISPR-associated protein n=1 Tax=Pyruvatibacter mobilis TaxID=1712261 RepID=UPI003D0BD971